jgi:hypothetical protein
MLAGIIILGSSQTNIARPHHTVETAHRDVFHLWRNVFSLRRNDYPKSDK